MLSRCTDHLLAYYTIHLFSFFTVSPRDRLEYQIQEQDFFICFVYGCFSPVPSNYTNWSLPPLWNTCVFLTWLPFLSYYISCPHSHHSSHWRGFIGPGLWSLNLLALLNRMSFHQLPPCSFTYLFQMFIPKTARSSPIVLFKSESLPFKPHTYCWNLQIPALLFLDNTHHSQIYKVSYMLSVGLSPSPPTDTDIPNFMRADIVLSFAHCYFPKI